MARIAARVRHRGCGLFDASNARTTYPVPDTATAGLDKPEQIAAALLGLSRGLGALTLFRVSTSYPRKDHLLCTASPENVQVMSTLGASFLRKFTIYNRTHPEVDVCFSQVVIDIINNEHDFGHKYISGCFLSFPKVFRKGYWNEYLFRPLNNSSE